MGRSLDIIGTFQDYPARRHYADHRQRSSCGALAHVSQDTKGMIMEEHKKRHEHEAKPDPKHAEKPDPQQEAEAADQAVKVAELQAKDIPDPFEV